MIIVPRLNYFMVITLIIALVGLKHSLRCTITITIAITFLGIAFDDLVALRKLQQVSALLAGAPETL